MLRVWHKVIFTLAPHEGVQMRARISRLMSLEPVPQCRRVGSRFEPVGNKARGFFGIVSLFIGIYAHSPCALAAVEEDASQDQSKYDYHIPTLSHELMTNLLNNYDNITNEDIDKYLSILDGSGSETQAVRHSTDTYVGSNYKFVYSTNSNGPGDSLIPEAVWSLDVSTGTHLDRIPGELGSDINAIVGNRLESIKLWTEENLSLWNDTDIYVVPLVTPLHFQVANCGGNSAEHSNLDYCNDGVTNLDQNDNKSTVYEHNISNITTQIANSSAVQSNEPSPSNLDSGFNIAPGPKPTNVDSLPSQGDLTFVGPCDDVSAPCATIQMDQPATLIDSPTPDFSMPDSPAPPIGDPTPPIDLTPPEVRPPNPIVSIDDPGLGSDLPPIFTPPPVASVPEASTWVMTIIGFGIVVFACGKRDGRRIMQVAVIHVPRWITKTVHRYSA
jgi:hypothetical protein